VINKPALGQVMRDSALLTYILHIITSRSDRITIVQMRVNVTTQSLHVFTSDSISADSSKYSRTVQADHLAPIHVKVKGAVFLTKV